MPQHACHDGNDMHATDLLGVTSITKLTLACLVCLHLVCLQVSTYHYEPGY